MASQAQIQDEIYARQLQSQEFASQNGTNSALSNQTLSDEQLARRLAMEEEQAVRASRALSPTPAPAPTPAHFALASGQTTKVRIQHVSSRRQIGETVLAHLVNSDEMVFELANMPGKYLKARQNGVIEFDYGRDTTATFRIENAASNSHKLYLAPRAFSLAQNAHGGVGWYLSMSAAGRLFANGGKSSESEWMLVAAPSASVTPFSVSPAPAPTSPLHAPPPQVVSSQTTVVFPGFNAGRERLMSFFSTPAGRAFLAQSDYASARALYEENPVSLSRLLHRPDWPLVSHRYRSYAFPSLAMREREVDLAVDAESLRDFYRNGFVTLRGLVDRDLVRDALKATNFWLFKFCGAPLSTAPRAVVNADGLAKTSLSVNALECRGDIERDIDVLALYYHSLLPSVTQKLLGKELVSHPRIAQAVSLSPSLDLLPSPTLRGDRWVVEGFTARGEHSPHNLLIGVALTDVDDLDKGNFAVHPGSHLTLMEEYRRQAQLKSTLFSVNPLEHQKPDLGEPQQLCLKAGDVFICTQRLAHLFAKNTSATPSVFVFFRVSHVEHDIFKDAALLSLWLEFKDAANYLDPVSEARSVLRSAEDSLPVPRVFPAAVSLPSTNTSTASLYLAPVPVNPPQEPEVLTSFIVEQRQQQTTEPAAHEQQDHSLYSNAYISPNAELESESLLNSAAQDET